MKTRQITNALPWALEGLYVSKTGKRKKEIIYFATHREAAQFQTKYGGVLYKIVEGKKVLSR